MTALDEIKRRAYIDIDQLDPQTAEKLGPFCDMSKYCIQRRSKGERAEVRVDFAEHTIASNQALIAAVVTSDPDSAIVIEVIAQAKADTKSNDEAVELAIDLFVGPLNKDHLLMTRRSFLPKLFFRISQVEFTLNYPPDFPSPSPDLWNTATA